MTRPRHFLVLFFLSGVLSFWPPPHDIRLEDVETFVISEFGGDELVGDEDEMISVKPEQDQAKYSRIHQMALKHNKRELDQMGKVPKSVRKFPEMNFYLDEEDWMDSVQDNRNVYYLNEMKKSVQQKREDKDYDYGRLKADFESEIEKAKFDNKTLNFTDVKEDESVKDAVDAVVDFKKPKNCSAEENKGIGISAIECLAADLKTAKSRNRLINLIGKILRISAIWFCVYLAIAIPCWCQRGWCCCCCCCKCCRPRQSIEEAKRFFTQNPVGVFDKKQYTPTHYEAYVQNQLEKALLAL